MTGPLTACVLGVSMLAAGCAFYSAPVVPAIAGVYTNIEAPLDVDYEQTQIGSRTGSATANSVLGLFAWGDASAKAAADDGGITTIRNADYRYMNILGVYTAFTTVVTGD